jgi:hypothetical protein
VGGWTGTAAFEGSGFGVAPVGKGWLLAKESPVVILEMSIMFSQIPLD